jgi:hypothetical protein
MYARRFGARGHTQEINVGGQRRRIIGKRRRRRRKVRKEGEDRKYDVELVDKIKRRTRREGKKRRKR